MNFVNRRTVLIASLLAVVVCSAGSLYAGFFSQTRTMTVNYFFGTSSLAEFDQWKVTYAPWVGSLEFDFRVNGTTEMRDLDYGDVGYGTYNVFGNNNNRITLIHVSPNLGYQLRVEYYRVGTTNDWWGEIYCNGQVVGHLRGQM